MTSIIPVRPFGKDPRDISDSIPRKPTTIHSDTSQGNHADFLIEFYDLVVRISRVMYQGVRYVVYVSKQPIIGLDGTRISRYNAACEKTLNNHQAGTPPTVLQLGVASAPFYHAIFKTLFGQRNNPLLAHNVCTLRDSLESMLMQGNVMTNSRVSATPHDSDLLRISHACGSKHQSHVSVSIQNLYGLYFAKILTAPSGEAYAKAMFGDSIESVQEVYRWLGGDKVLLWNMDRAIHGDAIVFRVEKAKEFLIDATLKKSNFLGVCAFGDAFGDNRGHFP